MKNFRGIYPALLTPFDVNGGLNSAALNELVDLNLKKGVDGFYVCGSTAEAFLLDSGMRRRILEAVVERNNGAGRVIAHIGAINQAEAVALAKHAEAAGADAVSSIPPFYYGFDFACIREYYFAIADAVDIPVLVYNFPANSGVKLTVEQLREFMNDPRFLGVKHTSSDFYMLEQIKAMRADAIVYNGYDEMFLSGLAAGADGGIGSTYNFMAEKFIAIRRHFMAGENARALEIQAQANAILSVLMRVGIMPGEKAALEMMGIQMGQCLKPFPTLTDTQLAELKRALISNGCELA